MVLGFWVEFLFLTLAATKRSLAVASNIYNNKFHKPTKQSLAVAGEQATEAAKRYLKIAEDNNMTLAQMSLAFVNQRPFVTSTIIGATQMEQLKENIESINVALSEDVLKQIDEVHQVLPNPAP
tara:strand:+ start:172 stop:543 length:372 start_codon:yes stop_codon:yes gene_type:complete